MIAPARRIWLVQPHAYTEPLRVEIIVLGPPEEIAPFVAMLARVLGDAPGLEMVRPLVMGAQQVGFTATRSNRATFDNPITETLVLLAQRSPERIDFDVETTHAISGTW